MKILMLLESEFPHDVRVENEMEALAEAGHEVHLACTTRQQRPLTEKFGKAVIHRKPLSTFTYRSSAGALKLPFYFNFWRKYTSELFSHERFDAVHVHDLPLGTIGSELKRTRNIPFILDLHENWPGLMNISPHTKSLAGRLLCSIRQWENYERNYVRKADALIVVVDESAERMIGMSVPPERISVVSNTLNLRGFPHSVPQKRSSTGKKIIIYEGGVTYHRGIQYVIRALSRICRPGFEVEFHVAGTGKYLETLRKLSADLNLDKFVKFSGWQAQEKIYEMIGQADLAVIPHIRSPHTDTTIPHKLFHYMYAGLPILASDCTPIKRIINETSSGYIYRYDDIDELAARISEILTAPGTGTQSGGREWVLRKYNWDVDKRRLTEVYNRLSQNASQ